MGFGKVKTYYDTVRKELTFYKRTWTKAEKDRMVEVGELQHHQNQYQLDDAGIFRTLYGKKVYIEELKEK